jgi:hypothetical protein
MEVAVEDEEMLSTPMLSRFGVSPASRAAAPHLWWDDVAYPALALFAATHIHIPFVASPNTTSVQSCKLPAYALFPHRYKCSRMISNQSFGLELSSGRILMTDPEALTIHTLAEANREHRWIPDPLDSPEDDSSAEYVCNLSMLCNKRVGNWFLGMIRDPGRSDRGFWRSTGTRRGWNRLTCFKK